MGLDTLYGLNKPLTNENLSALDKLQKIAHKEYALVKMFLKSKFIFE